MIPSVDVGLIGHPHEQRHPVSDDATVGQRVGVVELLAHEISGLPDLVHRQLQVPKCAQNLRLDHAYERHTRPASTRGLHGVDERRLAALEEQYVEGALGHAEVARVTERAANERRIAEMVEARKAGVSWSAIGGMLGTSGEAARKRYRR